MVCRTIAPLKTGAFCNYNFLRRSCNSPRIGSVAVTTSALSLEDGYTSSFSSGTFTNNSVIRPNSPQSRCSKLGRVIPALLCYLFLLQTKISAMKYGTEEGIYVHADYTRGHPTFF